MAIDVESAKELLRIYQRTQRMLSLKPKELPEPVGGEDFKDSAAYSVDMSGYYAMQNSIQKQIRKLKEQRESYIQNRGENHG